MSLSKREAAAIRELRALPPDDWSAHDWAIYEVSVTVLFDALEHYERVQARAAAVQAGRSRPVTRRKREPVALRDARPVVYDRSGGRCEAGTPVCVEAASHVHHRKGRQGADAHSPAMLLHVCEPCHRYIHAHPAESIERGWMVSRLGVKG